MKHIIWMAALVLTAATWSACSNKENLTVAEEPEQPRTYTVTTTLSPRDGAATRSTMTDNGDGSISSEWQVGDQLWVGYYNNTSETPVETTATVTAVDLSTKAATITVTLIDPKDGGAIGFGYPYSLYTGTKKLRTDQIGTLDDINANFASIYGDGTLTVSGSDVTLPAVTMEPAMCIWKFSFTDGANDITSAITKLVIDFPNDDEDPYEITPSSLRTIYVAIFADSNVINAEPICITAQTSTGVYRKAAASVTLAAGRTYTSTVALSNAQIGKLFGADGNIYANEAAATAAGTTPIAMICYVGAAGSADSSTGSEAYMGMALALTDAGTNVKWCSKYGAICLPTQYASGQQTNDMAGIANTTNLVIGHAAPNTRTHPAASAARNYNSGTHPTGTSEWFLPSAGQWDKMVNACKNVLGTNNNYEDLRDGFSARGGTNLLNAYYQTSTENSASMSFRYDFSTGNNGNIDYKDVNGGGYVRPAFAF
ncbi:MAG: hypothetical protein E7109_01945 [Bacteroidales bacterium]|nr:hypothetical protein [Bacteroidales bacterium]